MKVLADTHERLIEREPGLYTDDGEIKRIWQSEADAVLAVANHSLEDEPGKKEAQSRDADQKREIVKALKQCDRAETNQCHQNASAEVVIDVDGVAESSLNQQATSARYVSGGERNGFAERIECLFESFTDGGFIFRLLLLLCTQSAQTRAEHGARSDRSRAKGEDCRDYGQENDNDEDKRHHDVQATLGA